MRFLDGEASLHVGEASWFVVAGVEDKFSELDIDAFWRSQLYVTGNHSQYQLPESDIFQHQRHNTKLTGDLLRSRELSMMTFLVKGGLKSCSTTKESKTHSKLKDDATFSELKRFAHATLVDAIP